MHLSDNGNQNLVESLLNKGADLNIKNLECEIAIYLSSDKGANKYRELLPVFKTHIRYRIDNEINSLDLEADS